MIRCVLIHCFSPEVVLLPFPHSCSLHVVNYHFWISSIFSVFFSSILRFFLANPGNDWCGGELNPLCPLQQRFILHTVDGCEKSAPDTGSDVFSMTYRVSPAFGAARSRSVCTDHWMCSSLANGLVNITIGGVAINHPIVDISSMGIDNDYIIYIYKYYKSG